MRTKRGRPVVETKETKLSLRRERGRLAQRAYRQRQISEIESLHTRLESFEQAVQKVDIAAAHLDASLEGLGAYPSSVSDDGIVLGHQRRHLRSVIEAALKLSRPKGLENHNDDGPNEQLLANEITPELTASADLVVLDAAGETGMPTASSAEPSILQLEQRGLGLNLDWFPQMALPLRVPSLDPPVHPPLDIFPYLYGGSKTFAGALFWHSLFVAYSRLQDLLFFELDATENHNEVEERPALKMFAFSFRHDSATSIRYRISARLKFRETLATDSFGGAFGDDGSSRLHLQVIQDLMQAGRSIDQYLDAREVEHRLRLFCASPNAKMFGGEPLNLEGVDSTSLAPEALLHSLVEALARESICFGDGPRYKVDVVDSTLKKVMRASLEAALVSQSRGAAPL